MVIGFFLPIIHLFFLSTASRSQALSSSSLHLQQQASSASLNSVVAPAAATVLLDDSSQLPTAQSSQPIARDNGGSFNYSGGRLLVQPITVYLIWVGPWQEDSKEVIRNAIRSLTPESNGDSSCGGDYPSLSNWWKIATHYTDMNGRPVSGNVSLASAECSSKIQDVTREALKSVVLEAFNSSSKQGQPFTQCTSLFPQDDTAIYHLLISKKAQIGDAEYSSCTKRTELFRVEETGPEINLAWTREPRSREFCNLWGTFGDFLASPNGGNDGGLDTLISTVLAQTVDMATNTDFHGWMSNARNPVSSRCPSPTGWAESKMPVIQDPQSKTSWNLCGVNGSRYMVQQLWNQRTGNCALQPTEQCSIFRELSDQKGLISNGLVVNHQVGLQPYNSNLTCIWIISVPKAVYIRLTVNYLAITPGTDRIELYACELLASWIYSLFGLLPDIDNNCLARTYSGVPLQSQQVDLTTTLVLLRFTTGVRTSPNSMGWEVQYKAGFCSGITSFKEPSETISDGTPEGQNYLENHECGWQLLAEEDTQVHLRFTRFHTIQNKDRLVVYRGDAADPLQVLKVYTGNYSVLPNDTFTGPVLLMFYTSTGDGHGWAINYSMHPAESKMPVGTIVVGALCGMVVFSIGAMVLACNLHHLFQQGAEDTEMKNPLLQRKYVFSRADLNKATELFSTNNLIAKGPDASVFKGVLPQNKAIAVKSSRRDSVVNEFELLSKLNHPNVVSIIGFCFDTMDKFLVFKYVPNGSLAGHLFSNVSTSISWDIRLRIGVQISRALEYLHTFAVPSIVHRNISSDNILLDGSWNAKLAGFGSAFACHTDVDSSTASGSPLRQSSLKAEDVYRFGGLILELLMGQRAWDEHSNEASSMARWACHVIESGATFSILDKGLELAGESNCDLSAVMKMAEIGAWCMKDRARERPTMVEVSSGLRQVLSIFLRNQSKPTTHQEQVRESSNTSLE